MRLSARLLVFLGTPLFALADVPPPPPPAPTPAKEEIKPQAEPKKTAALPEHAPIFVSPTVSNRTNRSVEISVAVGGAKKLYLSVVPVDLKSSVDSIANWLEPRVVGPGGMKKLSEMTPVKATSANGEVAKNQTAGGKPFVHLGQSIDYGFGVKAPSVIEIDLPEGCAQFIATGSVDPMDEKLKDLKSSVRFVIYTDQPGSAYLPADEAKISAAKKLAHEQKQIELAQRRQERALQELEKQKQKMEAYKRRLEEQKPK
jgi:hypothetical protein